MGAQLRRAVTVCGLVALVAAACGPTPTAEVTPAVSRPGEEVPLPGGRVIDSGFSDLQQLNPAMSNDATSTRISGRIYDSLISIDPNTGQAQPWLGSWTVSSDGLTFTWTIDAKANWSDGKPIVARDWLARVKMQGRSKVTLNKSVFNDIEGYQDYSAGKATDIPGIKIDSADPKQLTVKFTRVFCPALINVFGPAPMPDHVFGKYTVDNDPTKNVDDAPENNDPPVASGPFKFKEWRKGDQTILVRNDRYFKGAPRLAEYVYKVVADPSVQAAQLKTGELSMGVIRPADAAALEGDPRLKLYRWPDNAYTFIAWRTIDPKVAFLRDKRVRQALWYGLDIEAVIRDALLGEGSRHLQHHVAGSWAAAPVAQLDRYQYDRTKAEDLLRQAGYAKGADGVYAKEGRSLAVTIVTTYPNKERDAFLRIASEQYRQLGISIEPKTEPFDSLVPKLTGGSSEVQAVLIGWQLASEPDPFTVWHSSNVASPTKAGNNIVGYSDPRVDQLIEQARYGPDCSQTARQKAYQQMNRILNEDAPYMFGVAANRILAADARIQGIAPGTFYPNGDARIHLWWLKR